MARMNGEKLIKSKRRVKDFAEVYTPSWLVKDMCSLVPECTLEQIWLEPACGNGNFLVEILQRKLVLCHTEADVLKAVWTVYGVDLLPDNVVEAKSRMYKLVQESGLPFDSMDVTVALNCNIQQGDFLTMKKFSGADLKFVDWSKVEV